MSVREGNTRKENAVLIKQTPLILTMLDKRRRHYSAKNAFLFPSLCLAHKRTSTHTCSLNWNSWLPAHSVSGKQKKIYSVSFWSLSFTPEACSHHFLHHQSCSPLFSLTVHLSIFLPRALTVHLVSSHASVPHISSRIYILPQNIML